MPSLSKLPDRSCDESPCLCDKPPFFVNNCHFGPHPGKRSANETQKDFAADNLVVKTKCIIM